MFHFPPAVSLSQFRSIMKQFTMEFTAIQRQNSWTSIEQFVWGQIYGFWLTKIASPHLSRKKNCEKIVEIRQKCKLLHNVLWCICNGWIHKVLGGLTIWAVCSQGSKHKTYYDHIIVSTGYQCVGTIVLSDLLSLTDFSQHHWFPCWTSQERLFYVSFFLCESFLFLYLKANGSLC